MELLTLQNPVFSAYVWYSALLGIKMLALSDFITILRIRKKVFCNPEDIKANSNVCVKLDDPDVERARRAHLNDVENITVFWIIGFLYVLTDPHTSIAINLFRTFFVARVMHTFVYTILIIKQPARGLAFLCGLFVTLYMILQVLLYFT